MATTLIAAVGIGLTYLGNLFNRPKKEKPQSNDLPTTLAERGSYVPRGYGRVRTGYVFAATWGKKNKTKKAGGGCGFGGSSGGPTTFYESGLHVLAVGAVNRLHAIYAGGKKIWSGPITDTGSPSGTVVDVDDDGSFVIYWGNPDQPIDSVLTTQLGVASRFPHFCFVRWIDKSLGGSPTWPVIEYEWESNPEGATNVGTGINAADVFKSMLCDPFPQGCAIAFSNISGGYFDSMQAVASAESFGCNFVVADGQAADDALAKLMDEFNFVLPQFGTLLYPYAIRPANPSGLPELNSDTVESTAIEQTRYHGDVHADKLIFTYRDPTLNFRPRDIDIDRDGQALSRSRPHIRKTQIETVTDADVAYEIAKRALQREAIGPTVFKLTAFRGARVWRAGTPFLLDGIDGTLRVTSVLPSFDDLSAQVEAVFDQYLSNSPACYDGGGNPDDGSLDPEIDIFFRALPVVEVAGAAEDGGKVGLLVPRVRAHAQIIGAEIWIATDALGPYIKIGNQDIACAGAVMRESILTTDTSPIASGPKVTPWGPDFPDDVLDLTGNDDAWNAGQQVLVQEDEALYLRRVEDIGAGEFRTHDLLRAQDGTIVPVYDHAVDPDPGSKVVIFERPNQTVFHHPLIVPGATLFVKTRPFTTRKAVTLDAVSPGELTFPT